MPLTKATTNVVNLNQPTVIDDVTISSGAGTGVENVGVGVSTLESNTTGAANVAVGVGALQFNTTGSNNIGIGRVACRTNTTGGSNIGIGTFALQSNNGDSNTAIGISAMITNTTGTQNVAVGNNALQSTTTGSFNTAIGLTALGQLNTTGSENVAIGRVAMAQASGSENVGIGVFSLYSSSGSFNTAVGRSTLVANTTGANNTAIGRAALASNTIGNLNTALGESALSTNVNYNNTTGIGYDAQVSGSNQIRIGDTNITSVTCQTNAWSDQRDKADIRDTVLGLDFIKELRPVDFKWDYREDYRPEAPKLVAKPLDLKEDASAEEKAKYAQELAEYNAFVVANNKWIEDSKWANLVHDGTHKRTRFHHGLIAQEVKALIEKTGVDFGGFQDHTIKGGDAVMTIGYTELIGPLIKAIQELSAKVAELEAK
jgi:hypothetical protein